MQTSLQTSIATVTLRGIGPYSQSRQHDAPMLEGESHDDYERRTWAEKLTCETIDGREVMVIPATALHQCFVAAAKYSKKKITGQRGATWTPKFQGGIAFMHNPVLGIAKRDVPSVVVSCNPQGIPGGRGRVKRYFPQIAPGWEVTFEIHILDPILTPEIVQEVIAIAGMFIGIGRWRAEKGGMNGRFQVAAFEWQDNRQFLEAAD
jgi:hypothetical protein